MTYMVYIYTIYGIYIYIPYMVFIYIYIYCLIALSQGADRVIMRAILKDHGRIAVW